MAKKQSQDIDNQEEEIIEDDGSGSGYSIGDLGVIEGGDADTDDYETDLDEYEESEDISASAGKASRTTGSTDTFEEEGSSDEDDFLAGMESIDENEDWPEDYQ